jgi:HEAT repeat protein
MSAKVATQNALDVTEKLVQMTSDDVPRVRAAALRGLGSLGTAEHAETITALLRDPEKDVRRAAQQSRDTLEVRLRE